MATPYTIERAEACEPSPEWNDGAYISYVHHLMGAGTKFTSFNMGNDDPLVDDIGPLARELADRLPSKHAALQRASRAAILDTFLAVSVVRTCVRNGHGEEPLPEYPDIPANEVAGYYVITKDPECRIPIQVATLPGNRVGRIANVGTAYRLDLPNKPLVNNVIYLPKPPGLETLVQQSVLATTNRGSLTDHLMALHQLNNFDTPPDEPLPRNTKFLEHITTRRQLGK